MSSSPARAPCPACSGTDFSPLFEKKGRSFWRCGTCGLERIDPPPTLRELEDYYNSSYSSGLYSLFIQEEEMKRLTAEHRLSRIRKFVPDGRWLDVGCANGTLVKAARAAGFEAEGIDLSSVAVEAGRSEGLPLSVSTLEDWMPPYRYSTITGFDILEHVLDPLGFAENVARLLEPGGVAVIAVPNTRSVFARVMGKSWWFYIPEEHLTYFHPDSIGRLYRRAGLEPTHVGRATKPLTLSYGLTQFKEYNPLIYRALKTVSYVLPQRAMDAILPFYIGEMMSVARRPVDEPALRGRVAD
jgi:2-polyprenyl-3-methyl-5-hydroxy-6-metoxy-1,4-benzoquinol methylase